MKPPGPQAGRELLEAASCCSKNGAHPCAPPLRGLPGLVAATHGRWGSRAQKLAAGRFDVLPATQGVSSACHSRCCCCCCSRLSNPVRRGMRIG